MSMHIEPFPVLPEATARVAKAAFKRRGNIYLTIGDQLGPLFDDVDFTCLYAVDGKPALSPNLVVLVRSFSLWRTCPTARRLMPSVPAWIGSMPCICRWKIPVLMIRC
jgi:hypothetical protein